MKCSSMTSVVCIRFRLARHGVYCLVFSRSPGARGRLEERDVPAFHDDLRFGVGDTVKPTAEVKSA